MEYADVVVKGEDISDSLTTMIQESSKDKQFEINSDEQDELFESYYNIYTDLAG
jgi:starch synthase